MVGGTTPPTAVPIERDRQRLRAQYGDETCLSTRRSVWQPDEHGRDPVVGAVDAVVAERPGRLLEIGCGTGHLARALRGVLPLCQVVVTDQSPRMVELATDSGELPGAVVDATRLPLPDDAVDVVCAMWMLYHVPDLTAALAEARRVLRSGGLFVVATNGDEHLADLLTEAGGQPLRTQLSRENGGSVLLQHFDVVDQVDFSTRAVFPDHAAAQAYLATFAPLLAEQLPPFAGERSYRGASTLFLCR